MKIEYIKLLLSILVFSISSIFVAFAEVEVEPSIDIYKSYEGWYKNFIVECGACRITLRNYDGSIINDYYVLPKQFESNTEITRVLNYAGVDNQKDSEGRTILFMQKNDGKLNLNDYIYKALNGSELERKYSDNIPQLSNNYGGNKKELPYIYFEEFSEYTTVESWKEYNNGENVNNLATDLGINTATLCKNPIDNKEISFYEWVTTPNADGVSPTLELQPITLYPETTEQIYCNDFYTAQDYNLQWNSDMGAYCEELNKSSSNIFDQIGGFFDGILMKVFGSKKIGIGDLITFYNGRIVYYDVGVMVTEVKEVGVETGAGKTYVNSHARDWDDIDMVKFAEMFPDSKERLKKQLSDLTEEQYNALLKSDSQKNEVDSLSIQSEISKVIVKEILAPKYVPLTYTETTKYSHPWETKGFWANYQKIDVSKIDKTLEVMLDSYFNYNVINNGSNQTITNMNVNQYNTIYKPLMEQYNNLEAKTEQTVTNLLKSMDKYYLDFESFYKKDGYIREGDSFHLPEYKGIGDTTTIKTDHNKYVTIINLIEKCRKTFEILLTLPNFLCSNYPKYGAGIIVNGNSPIATPSEATESEADPLTNDGYVLYEDELSYVYTYDDIGNEATRRLTGTNY